MFPALWQQKAFGLLSGTIHHSQQAVIHSGKLIFLGYPHPSTENLWDGLGLPIHHLLSPMRLNPMQVASVSCSSGDMEEPVHSPGSRQ